MTLTVRLPSRVEQELADYCVTHGVSKSDAVKQALKDMLRPSADGASSMDHPFIGADKGDGSDVSGNIKSALRARFRKAR